MNELLAARGTDPLSRRAADRAGQPAQGVRRRVPRLRHRGDLRRGLQPRGRGPRPGEHRLLRPPGRPGTGQQRSTSRRQARRAGGSSPSTGQGFAVPDRQRADVPRGLPRRRAALRRGVGDRRATGGWGVLPGADRRAAGRGAEAALIAEYWGQHRWLAVQAPLRRAWASTSGTPTDCGTPCAACSRRRRMAPTPRSPWTAIRTGLEKPWNVPWAWQAYNCLENHDLVLDADGDHRSHASRGWPTAATRVPGTPAAGPASRPGCY